MKRAFVSLPDGVWNIIRQDLKGVLGDGDSEVIRNIVISYLSDKGYFINKKGLNALPDIEDKIDVLDHLTSSVIDLLEEKKIITLREVDKRMQNLIANEGAVSPDDPSKNNN